MRYLHLAVILVFLAGMIYAAILVYNKPRSVLTPASFPTIQVEKKISELQKPFEDRSSTIASGEISLDEISPTSEEDKSEPVGGSGMVAEVKLPGFSVSLPESSSWMTVAKMISLILLTYLGVKTINLSFRKMEASLLRGRARRA